MNARGTFTVGQRVKLTTEGQQMVLSKRKNVVPSDRGVVRGFGRAPHLLRILRDGHVTIESWDAGYWEPDSEASS